ncbi:Ig-like domain repeat protein [Neobacillus sp. K501]
MAKRVIVLLGMLIGLPGMVWADTSLASIPNKELIIENSSADVTGPTLDSIDLSSTSVKVGEVLTITVKAIDDFSSVNKVNVNLHNPEKDVSKYLTLNYDSNSGKWIGKYMVEKNDIDGPYDIHISMQDEVGNGTQLFFVGNFNVENPYFDRNAPVLNGVELSNTELNYGEELVITAFVQDDKSGVQSVSGTIKDPNGSDRPLEFIYDKTSEKWISGFSIIPSDLPGVWKLQYIYLKDNFGNSSWQSIDKTFTISNIWFISPSYYDACWYYSIQNYYNAVYFAGVAIAEGDSRAEVQDLMNNAAKGLYNAAATMNMEDAKNSYQLLISAQGVPSNLKAAAEEKLKTPTVVKSPKYEEASWYYSNQNYYNAVYFAGAAIAEGDTRLEVQELMNSASTALYNYASRMNSEDAKYAYQLLASSPGVPSDIKIAAEVKLETPPAVKSLKYDDACWYYSIQNYYNAVYFAGAAIAEGDTRPELQELMNNASKALFNDASRMNSEDAKYAYQLLVSSPGVPSDIKEEAQEKLKPVVVSAKYNEAVWYFSVANYFNAVYFAGAALDEGDARTEVQELMKDSASKLLNAAETMTSEDAGYAYQLLASTTGVPADIRDSAEAKLSK